MRRSRSISTKAIMSMKGAAVRSAPARGRRDRRPSALRRRREKFIAQHFEPGDLGAAQFGDDAAALGVVDARLAHREPQPLTGAPGSAEGFCRLAAVWHAACGFSTAQLLVKTCFNEETGVQASGERRAQKCRGFAHGTTRCSAGHENLAFAEHRHVAGKAMQRPRRNLADARAFGFKARPSRR